MKIKSLPLLLAFTGIIIISGCVDAGAQPLGPKAPENLYRSIFYPYAGLLDHRHSEISGPGVSEENSHHHLEGPGYVLIVHNLGDATILLDRNIEKAENISARLKEGIQSYKTEGKDVSKLEALLEKYNLLVEDAKRYRALAGAAVSEGNNSSIVNSENSSSENTRRKYLIKSQKSMIKANFIMKEIFKEFQRLRPWSEEINNKSRLSAAGDGKVSLIGNFNLNLHLEKGDIAIPDLSPDSEIYITGDYIFKEKTGMQGDVLRLYHIFSADAKIFGSRKTVLLKGSNITLSATGGEGYVVFLGSGTYRIEDTDGIIKEQKWANPFPEEGTNSDKYGSDENDNDAATGPIGSNISEENKANLAAMGQEKFYQRKSINFPENKYKNNKYLER
jgi:hypothetical protein